MAFSIYDLLRRKDKEKKKPFDLLSFLREKASGIERTGEKIGKKLQEFPDTTIRQPQIKTGNNLLDFLLNPNPIQRKIEESVTGLPGNIVRSYGKTTERLSTEKGREEIGQGARELRTKPISLETLQNPAVQTAFDVSDFVPGIGIFGVGGIKRIAKEGIEQVVKKETPRSFDFLLNPQRFSARIKELENSGRASIKDELSMFKKWGETIKNATSLDRIKRFIKGENDLLLLPKEKKIAKEMQDYLTKFPKQPTIEQVSQAESQSLREAQAEMRAAKALDPNQQLFTKMRNLLRITGEKQNKVGELYREHIPKNIFGQSSDELASTMGISKNELMAKLTEGLNISEGLRKSRGFTNVRAYDNPLILGKDYQRLRRNVDEGRKFVDEMREDSIRPTQDMSRLVGRNVDDTFNRSKDNLIDDFMKSRDVKNKVNALDYLRTPENVLKKIGLGSEADLLRKADEGYKSELRSELEKLAGWIKQAPSKESSQKIFKVLNGEAQLLSKPEQQVADEMRKNFKTWADKLRLPEDKKIGNYITHLFEKGFIEKEFDEDLAKLIDVSGVPGSVYNPFKQKRTDAPHYIEDAYRAYEAYVKRGTRDSNMTPALEKLKQSSKDLDLESLKYVERFSKNLNMQPKEVDSLADNFIKSSPVGYRLGQRPITTVARVFRQMVYRGALGLNISSAFVNLSQGANTFAKLGLKNTFAGYRELVGKNAAGNFEELRRVGVLDQSFIQDRSLHAVRNILQKADDGLFVFFDTAEKINRGSAYFGAKRQALKQGKTLEEAVELGKQMVRTTQFSYSPLDTPVLLQGDIAKTIGQFSTYPIKQFEFLAGMVKNKEWLGIAKWLGATLLFYETAGKLMGRDPLEAIPFSGIITGQEKFNPPILQVGGNLLGMASLDEDKREQAKRDLLRSASLLIPGGVQAKKTFEGISAFREGASLTPSGRIRYAIPQNFPNALRTALFGQYSLPQAKEYFKNKQSGRNRSEVLYDEIKDLPINEKLKRMVKIKIKSPTLFDEVKQKLRDDLLHVSENDRKIRELPIIDGSRSRAILKEFEKLKTKEEKQKLFTQMLVKKILTKDVLTYFVKEKINLIER